MSTKKLFWFLILVVLITLAIFIKQIYRTIGISITPSAEPIISTNIYDIPIDTTETPRGNPGAGITVVEFLDLGCDDCVEKFHAINNETDKKPQDIRLFLKPAKTGGIFADDSLLAHSAAFCANKQNKYWAFVDALMTKEKRTAENVLKEVAGEAKLNIDTWWRCTQQNETKVAVNRALELAQSLGVKNSPTLYVNNKRLISDPKIDLADVLKKIIPEK